MLKKYTLTIAMTFMAICAMNAQENSLTKKL